MITCNNKAGHSWHGADDLRFMAAPHSNCDIFCVYCDAGAFTDERGEVIESSIAPVGFVEIKEE